MKTKQAALLVPTLLLALVLTGFSCTKKAAEKNAERAIENATNGQADVDLSNSSIRVNTNGSSWETGESVNLPSDFPSDVFVADGTIKSAITTDENSGFTISIEAEDSIADTKTRYESELVGDGWTITTSATYGSGSASLVATKDNRTTTVSMAEADGKTTVVLTTMTNPSL